MEEFQKSMDFQLKIKHRIKILESLIDRAPCTSVSNVNQNNVQLIHNVPVASPNVRLPKMKFKKFNGDPNNWREFVECFEATIAKNNQMSNIEKMNYLITHLEGEAEAALKGLKLCNDNYDTAHDLLKERFGDKQTRISGYMNKLLSLNNVYDSTGIKSLRKLFDNIETQVPSLNCLG